MFFKKSGKNIRRAVILKERFNKMEIEIDSENESRQKRIRKLPLFLSQEESLAEKAKKHPCRLNKSQKTYKERDISQKFSLSKTFALFSRFDYFFFEVLKTKTVYKTLRCPSGFQLSKFCVTIIATITQ